MIKMTGKTNYASEHTSEIILTYCVFSKNNKLSFISSHFYIVLNMLFIKITLKFMIYYSVFISLYTVYVFVTD